MYTKRNIGIVIFFVVLLNACNASYGPDIVVKRMIAAIENGNLNTALDYVCDDMFFPNTPSNIHFVNDRYEIVSEDENFSVVHVIGEMRFDLILGEDNIGSGKILVDFEVYTQKKGDSWCVENESFFNFIQALIDFKLEEK